MVSTTRGAVTLSSKMDINKMASKRKKTDKEKEKRREYRDVEPGRGKAENKIFLGTKC